MHKYRLDFNINMNIKSCEIESSSPSEAVEEQMKKYNYPCVVKVAVKKKLASVRVTLLNGKKKSVSYYSVCYTGFNRNMSLGMRSGIGRVLSQEEINFILGEARSIKMDVTKIRFNDSIHNRTCYVPDDDVIYIGSDIFPDTKSMSTNPIDLLSVKAVLAHEYYGHRPRRQQYLDEENNKIDRMDYWEDEYKANYDAAKNTPNLSDMDRYRLIQSAIRRCEEAGVFLERDKFITEVLYGTEYQ